MSEFRDLGFMGYPEIVVNKFGDIFRNNNGIMTKLRPRKLKGTSKHRFRFQHKNKLVEIPAGQTILLAFGIKPRNEKMIAVHKDGNKDNLALDNLQWAVRKERSRIPAMTPFGAKLKEYRIKNAMTQEELSEKIGIAHRQLNIYENTLVRPKSADVIRKFKDAFGEDWAEFEPLLNRKNKYGKNVQTGD